MGKSIIREIHACEKDTRKSEVYSEILYTEIYLI